MPRTSWLAASSLALVFPAIPAWWIGVAARGSDHDSLATPLFIAAPSCLILSLVLAISGIIAIGRSQGRLKGFGFSMGAIGLSVLGLIAIGSMTILGAVLKK